MVLLLAAGVAAGVGLERWLAASGAMAEAGPKILYWV